MCGRPPPGHPRNACQTTCLPGHLSRRMLTLCSSAHPSPSLVRGCRWQVSRAKLGDSSQWGDSGGRTTWLPQTPCRPKFCRVSSESQSSPGNTPFSTRTGSLTWTLSNPKFPGGITLEQATSLQALFIFHLCNGIRAVLGCCEGRWAEVGGWQWREQLVFVLFQSASGRGWGLEGALLPRPLCLQGLSLCRPPLLCLHLLGWGEKTGRRQGSAGWAQPLPSIPPIPHFLVTGF